MTELLEKAFDEAKKAPPEVQDAIGKLVLVELQDELLWQRAFEQTSDEQWDRLAEMVRKEIAAGETDSLDTLFP